MSATNPVSPTETGKHYWVGVLAMVIVFIVTFGIQASIIKTGFRTYQDLLGLIAFALSTVFALKTFSFVTKRSARVIIPEGWSYFFGTNNNPFVGPLRLIGTVLLVGFVWAIIESKPRSDWDPSDISPSMWFFYLIPGIALLLLARNLNKLKGVDE